MQEVKLVSFRAVQDAAGVQLEWQTPIAQSWSTFAVYFSQDCQWESAILLTAPLFSSVDSETEVVTYSLLDENSTSPPPCSYWVVGTEVSGAHHTFGPVSVQGLYAIYLPVVHQ